jgi:hypothetical protein
MHRLALERLALERLALGRPALATVQGLPWWLGRHPRLELQPLWVLVHLQKQHMGSETGAGGGAQFGIIRRIEAQKECIRA